RGIGMARGGAVDGDGAGSGAGRAAAILLWTETYQGVAGGVGRVELPGDGRAAELDLPGRADLGRTGGRIRPVVGGDPVSGEARKMTAREYHDLTKHSHQSV